MVGWCCRWSLACWLVLRSESLSCWASLRPLVICSLLFLSGLTARRDHVGNATSRVSNARYKHKPTHMAPLYAPPILYYRVEHHTSWAKLQFTCFRAAGSLRDDLSSRLIAKTQHATNGTLNGQHHSRNEAWSSFFSSVRNKPSCNATTPQQTQWCRQYRMR